MKRIKQLIATAFLLLWANITCHLQAQEPANPIDHLDSALESLAGNMGIDLKITHELSDSTLTIKAVMTDGDDSVEYIAGQLSHDNAMRLLSPYFAPTLLVMPDIIAVKGTVTDSENQTIDVMLTREEIMNAANGY